eukprot:2833639-Prymnesium_polylepis.2
MTTLPIGHSATIGHAIVRMLTCSGESSQRTRRSWAKYETSSTSLYVKAMQSQARKMLELTEGLKQN